MTYPTTLTKNLSLSSGENVFYREAGLSTSPTVLLLHGFPSSSHQYRKLIPVLAPHYHVLAPDLPSFGFTSVSDGYKYTFDNFAETIHRFLVEIPNAPAKTASMSSTTHPEMIQAIISQNGNAYNEGFGEFWNPIKALWASTNDAEAREPLRPILTLEGTKSQYFVGTADPSAISPESYTLDQALLERPGNKEIQLDIFYDYGSNPPLYPSWQKWFRESQVPLLAVWGKNDLIFVYPGAEAFKRDLPKAEVHLLDAAHFAVESHANEIGALIIGFLKRNGI